MWNEEIMSICYNVNEEEMVVCVMTIFYININEEEEVKAVN